MSERVELAPLGESGEDAKMLLIGDEAWPFPIALIKEEARWRYDTANGKEEILNRRIGENELSVLNLCQEYVSAQ